MTKGDDQTLLLTVAETAKLLCIGCNIACELAQRGELPAIKLRGRIIRITRLALEQWIAHGRVLERRLGEGVRRYKKGRARNRKTVPHEEEGGIAK